MTDEQIIIDGVDVSGCKNLMQGIVPFGCMEDRKTCSCMNNPNCLYKQLKRKEQECKELKKDKERLLQTIIKDQSEIVQKNIDETNILLIKENTDLQQQLDQLKAENDKFKEEKQGLIKDWEEKKNLAYEIACKNEKLKQTLTEIKSILELYANSKVGEEQSDGTYKLSSGICSIQNSFGFCTTTYDPRPAKQALQKISEVE